MKAGLVGAAPTQIQFDPDLPYIGVDGGVETLLAQKIMPMVVVGDYDSLKDKECLKKIKNIQLPQQKDDTDTAIAIEYLLSNGYNDIILYGVTGGRIDHFMAVLCMLKKYRDYSLTIMDEQNKIYLLKTGTHCIHKNEYHYVSFFADQETYITIKGCLYPLDRYLLKNNDPLCVSNEICGETCEIEITRDVIVIQSNNKGGI